MNLKNKKILITGGTGTIGSALVEELLKFAPSVIRIFSRDEYKQFQMQHRMKDHEHVRFLIGDVRDKERLYKAMEDIDIVFHLAAMKHVSSCEYNPFEAVKTNVLGTQNIIDVAIQQNVKHVVFTSTDKAIAPTNIYGATKLTAERLITSAHFHKGKHKTIFSSVRFGNVMGSRGSVIPLFVEQIQRGEAITVTDPEMVRYMMTPKQAVQLILETLRVSQGGEIFVLKMPKIRLQDLIDAIEGLLAERGLLNVGFEKRVVGLRPGEKMEEELMTDYEAGIAIDCGNMFCIPSYFGDRKVPDGKVDSEVYEGLLLDELIDQSTIREWLKSEQII